jgi:mono/diheme cytochrome c family protein
MRKIAAALSLMVLCLASALSQGCETIFPKRSEGEKLFRKRCAKCHGFDASGDTPRYMGQAWADLLDNGWKYGGDAPSMEIVIREGVMGKMPANDDLTSEQIRQIIHHIRVLRGEARVGDSHRPG